MMNCRVMNFVNKYNNLSNNELKWKGNDNGSEFRVTHDNQEIIITNGYDEYEELENFTLSVTRTNQLVNTYVITQNKYESKYVLLKSLYDHALASRLDFGDMFKPNHSIFNDTRDPNTLEISNDEFNQMITE